ncbi:MAG: glycosyl transferase family 1 [Chloroflexi bacterium]|nr:glycosyl transferase family 1 [Chloroflexota bacterium]
MAERLGRRRAIVIVPNPAAPYSRGLRVARSLAAEGWEVEIAAQEAVGLSPEERDGDVIVRRYGRSGPWIQKLARRPGRPGLGRLVVMKTYRLVARWSEWARHHPPPTSQDVRNKLLWPVLDRPWWHTLRQEVAPADLYHACGYRAIPVALDLAAAARSQGRAGRVVYDVIDIALESNTFASRHPAWKWLYRRRERGWARRSDAIVTVNEAIGDHLRRSFGTRDAPVILENMPPRWLPPATPPDLVRRAAGLGPDRRIILYLGRVVAGRGLAEAATAVGLLDRADLVLLGPVDGSWASSTMPGEALPVMLPAVHPDEVPAWAASADVSTVVRPPTSLNQRLSTPNKFWESLAGGTPVVVDRSADVMCQIVERDEVGVVVDGGDPREYARGLRTILDAPSPEREALRARCLKAAHERYNWETAIGPYLALVRRLVSA